MPWHLRLHRNYCFFIVSPTFCRPSIQVSDLFGIFAGVAGNNLQIASNGSLIFIYLIWAAAYIDTLYTWSAFNTELIGQYISQALEILVQNHPASKIHLIGHSLGAQIAGASGRLFNKATGRLVGRITGLGLTCEFV